MSLQHFQLLQMRDHIFLGYSPNSCILIVNVPSNLYHYLIVHLKLSQLCDAANKMYALKFVETGRETNLSNYR